MHLARPLWRADRVPPAASRILGAAGVVGGLALLAAFILEIPPEWNVLRLLLVYAGGIAIALAVHGLHAAVSRRVALAGSAPLVVAYAVAAGWTLLAIGREHPFAGSFGIVGFWTGLVMWLATAWFGIVALRSGTVWRPAALALAAGSLTALTGIDRFELTSQASSTIFAPIALTGIALTGVGWILLGIERIAAPPS